MCTSSCVFWLHLPAGCKTLLWLLSAFDSLHLTLLPQFNRQQRKKGRGHTSYKVLANLHREMSPCCVSIIGAANTRGQGRTRIRAFRSDVRVSVRWSRLEGNLTVMFLTVKANGGQRIAASRLAQVVSQHQPSLHQRKGGDPFMSVLYKIPTSCASSCMKTSSCELVRRRIKCIFDLKSIHCKHTLKVIDMLTNYLVGSLPKQLACKHPSFLNFTCRTYIFIQWPPIIFQRNNSVRFGISTVFPLKSHQTG